MVQKIMCKLLTKLRGYAMVFWVIKSGRGISKQWSKIKCV